MVIAMISAAEAPPEPKAISTANAPAIHAPTKGMKEVKKYKMKIGTASGIRKTNNGTRKIGAVIKAVMAVPLKYPRRDYLATPITSSDSPGSSRVTRASQAGNPRASRSTKNRKKIAKKAPTAKETAPEKVLDTAPKAP